MADAKPRAGYMKVKSRSGYSPLDAIDPHDQGTWTVLLPGKKLECIKSRGMGACLELVHTVRWALQNCRCIFRGVRDDEADVDDDGWLCYVASPGRAYDWKTGNQVPPWPDEVFLVYLTDERVVYHWCWVKCDPDDPRLPIDHRSRFREQIYGQTAHRIRCK